MTNQRLIQAAHAANDAESFILQHPALIQEFGRIDGRPHDPEFIQIVHERIWEAAKFFNQLELTRKAIGQ